MKQGRASHSGMGATKVEPISKAVSPGAVSNIGLAQGNKTDHGMVHVKSQPLYEGRGLRAPLISTTSHKSGSQGRH
jgi:hypothetical protein